MDIRMTRIDDGWQVSSVGMLKLPGSSELLDTQLEFIVRDDIKAKASGDSDETSADEASPLPAIVKCIKQRKVTPDIISTATTNTSSNISVEPTHKIRRISRYLQNMRKTSSVKEMANFIIYPDGALSYYWMSLVTLTVMYNIAVVILRLAFSEARDQQTFFLLDNISDVVYIVDILVQSRTAFLEEGCLVVDPGSMFQNYRKMFKFWLDVIAIFPITTLYWAGSVFINAITFNFAILFTVAPLPVLRFLRVLKYHQVATFFEIADSRTRRPSLLRAFKLSLHLWMVIHWIACIYYMVSEIEGLGTNDWVYTSDTSGGFRRKYIRSLYWSMMTLTTIGERPSPETDVEYIFTGTTFLIGVFVFAAVVGNVGDVISNMNAARHDFQSRMDQIKFYMNHRVVPEDLQDKVKKWAEYSWTRTQAMDEPSVLAMLPDRLRTEIAIHVHLETLKQVKIFEECEEGLLRELVLKLRPQIYSPGDYICRTGEIGREMYIINHGRIEILILQGNSSTRVALLKPGNYFGEISLLKLGDVQNRRTADVRAIGYSELLCLSRRDLISALSEYPEAKKILEAQAMQRMQEIKGVRKTDGSNTLSPTATHKSSEPVKRKASDVFSQVMKQEGFRKLISSRDHEMSELKHLIADLKTISLKQADPHNDSNDEKIRTLEQRLINKDTALKHAKRRINQLETYVRIRAYNSKYQRHSVPESDPKECTIPHPPNNSHSENLRNGTRVRKISGNLALMRSKTINQESESFDFTKKTKPLERSSSLPEKYSGFHQYNNRTTDMKSGYSGVIHNKHQIQPRVRSSSMLHSSNNIVDSSFANSYSDRTVETGNSDHVVNKVNSGHTVDNVYHSNRVSEYVVKNGVKMSSPTAQSETCVVNNTITPSGRHIATATIMLHPKRCNSKVEKEESLPTMKLRNVLCNMKLSRTTKKDRDVISVPSDKKEIHNANSQPDPVTFDQSFVRLTQQNSEETVDSGISDRDYLHEDEELFRLVELFSKDQSTDSNNTSLSLSGSNSELSSDDELDL